MPLSLSSASVVRPTRLGLSDLSDDHLRVLFDDASSRGDLSSADVAICAISHRRAEVGEDDWWIARRRCVDAWERLDADLPAGELARRLERVVTDRLEREVAHAWAARPRHRDHEVELLLWVTVDRTRGPEAARVVCTLLQVPEGEDVHPITVADPAADPAAVRGRIVEILGVIRATTPRRN